MENKISLITLSSDFGVQSQGVGIMEAVAFSIAPQARLIHFIHGLPQFDIVSAAWAMEGLTYIPVGCHVCVVDPGVGSSRKPIVCQVERGDYLIGPDNGVLMTAAKILGGIRNVHAITNPKYMRQPVSDIFHGRDIFAPAAAHLANGVGIDELGPSLGSSELVAAPYDEAQMTKDRIDSQIININRYGSIRLNIRHEQWDSLALANGATIILETDKHDPIKLKIGRIFSDVPPSDNLILKDDYGRMTVAKNLGSFIVQYPISIGENCRLILTDR